MSSSALLAPQMPCRRAQVASRASSCGTTADRRAVAASRSHLQSKRPVEGLRAWCHPLQGSTNYMQQLA